MAAPEFTIDTISTVNKLLPGAGGGKDNQSSDASIGCPMELIVEFTLTSGAFGGSSFRFNPILFLASGAPLLDQRLTVWWGVTLASGAGTGVYPMAMFTNNNGNEQANSNVSCDLEVTSSSTGFFRLKYRMTMDLGGRMDGSAVINAHRLAKAHRNDPENLVAPASHRSMSIPSVYKVSGRVLGVIVQSAEGVGEDLTTYTQVLSVPYASRYFEKGLPTSTGTQPDAEFMDDDFSWKAYRNGVEVSTLSTWSETELRWNLIATGSGALVDENIFVYLLKMEQYPNVDDYLTDYGCQGARIEAATVDGTEMGGNIIAHQPHIAAETVDGVERYVARFRVGADLDPTAYYMPILVVNGYMVSASDNTLTNTFVMQAMAVDSTPPTIDTDGVFLPSLGDYRHTYQSNKVVTTVGDRIISRFGIDVDAYGIAAMDQGLSQGIAEVLNGVTFSFGVPGGFFLIFQASVGFTTPGDPSTVYLFNAPRGLTVEYGAGIITFAFEVQNGYPNIGGHPDFSDVDLELTWAVTVAHVEGLGTYPYQYQFTQEVQVRPFDEDGETIESIRLLNASSGQPIDSMCDVERIMVEVILNEENTEEDGWVVRAFASPEPFGYLPGVSQLLTHEEDFCDPATGGTEQKESTVIELTQCEFVNRRAVFFLDATQFADMSKWRVFAVAQGPVPCTNFGFYLESGSVTDYFIHRFDMDGRKVFVRLGYEEEASADNLVWSAVWVEGSQGLGWYISGEGATELYFSAEDVETPDLVETWTHEDIGGVDELPVIGELQCLDEILEES